MFEIKEALRRECRCVDLAGAGDFFREILHLNVAALLQFFDVRGRGEVCREIQDGIFRELRIDNGAAIFHRAGQRVPTLENIFANRRETRVFSGIVSCVGLPTEGDRRQE